MDHGEAGWVIFFIFVFTVIATCAIAISATQEAMLNHWLEGAERQGSVVLYEDRVLTSDDVYIVFDKLEESEEGE